MKKFFAVFVAIIVCAGCGGPGKQESAQVPNTDYQASEISNSASATPSPLIAAGLMDLKKGKIKEALVSFEEAIKQNPRDAQGYIVLGETLMHLKNYERATQMFTMATRVDPQNGKAYYLLATTLGMAGNYNSARVEAAKSIEIFRRNKDANNFRKSLALLQGLPQAAPVKE